MKLFLSLLILVFFLQGCIGSNASMHGKKLQAGDTRKLVDQFNSDFNTMLKKYVDVSGNVDYASWHQDQKNLNKVFDTILSKIDSSKLSGNQKMVFFINVYNILTIKGMLSHYPIKSIMDKVSRVGGFHFWKDTYVQLSDAKFSLDQIEHKILRPMGDARIHYAIVCASKSCPPLRNEVFLTKTFNDQLNDQAIKFFSSPSNFLIDEDAEVIYYSSILKWFLEDFATSEAGLIASVTPYLSPNNKKVLDSIKINHYSISYLKYDWSINSQ